MIQNEEAEIVEPGTKEGRSNTSRRDGNGTEKSYLQPGHNHTRSFVIEFFQMTTK